MRSTRLILVCQVRATLARIVNLQQEGFDFLGYHFEKGTRWPCAKSLRKFKDTIRAQARRTEGRSLATREAMPKPAKGGTN